MIAGLLHKIWNMKKGYWVFLANILQSTVSVVILLLIIRLGTQEDVGNYSYVQGILLPIQLFFTLKLRTIQCADYNSKYSYYEYHGVRRTMALLNFLAGILVISLMFAEGQRFYVGFFLLISYTVLLLRESYVAQLLFKGVGKGYFFINGVNGFVSVVSFSTVYFLSENLVSAVAAVGLVRLLSYLFLEKRIVSKHLADAKLERVFKVWPLSTRYLVAKSWPLGVTALLGALFTTLPRLAVDYYQGVEMLGVFTAITSLLFFFNLLVNSFIQSALPSMALSYSIDIGAFRRKIISALCRIALTGFVCMLVVYLLGDYILWIVFGSEYRGYKFELLWVTVSGCFLALFSIGNLMLSSQQSFYIQFPIYGIVAAVISIGSVAGVQFYGIAGVLAGQSAGYLVGFFACYIFYKKYRLKGNE